MTGRVSKQTQFRFLVFYCRLKRRDYPVQLLTALKSDKYLSLYPKGLPLDEFITPTEWTTPQDLLQSVIEWRSAFPEPDNLVVSDLIMFRCIDPTTRPNSMQECTYTWKLVPDTTPDLGIYTQLPIAPGLLAQEVNYVIAHVAGYHHLMNMGDDVTYY